jgi:Tfp pilus assembly protein PilX
MFREFTVPALNQKGIALTLVIIVILLLTILAGAALSTSFNQRKLSSKAVGNRSQNFYAAKGGSVDAFERLRKNDTTGLTPTAPANGFDDPTYNPNPYTVNVGALPVSVDISAVNATTGLRTVKATSDN